MNNNTITIDLDKCFECGEPKQDMHHVIPKSKGGKKMIPLCAKCHGLVHGKNFLNHKYLIIDGMKKAKENGIHIGRKKNTKESLDTKLIKHNDIVIELLKGKSIRETIKLTNKSIVTIHKIRTILVERNLLK